MKQTSIDPAQNDLIRVKAYEIWLGRGCPNGSAERDWVEAEGVVAAMLAPNTPAQAELKSDGAERAPQNDQNTTARAVERPGKLETSPLSPATPPVEKNPGLARAHHGGDTRGRQVAKSPAAPASAKTRGQAASAQTAPASSPAREAGSGTRPAVTSSGPESGARQGANARARRTAGSPAPARRRKG